MQKMRTIRKRPSIPFGVSSREYGCGGARCLGFPEPGSRPATCSARTKVPGALARHMFDRGVAPTLRHMAPASYISNGGPFSGGARSTLLGPLSLVAYRTRQLATATARSIGITDASALSVTRPGHPARDGALESLLYCVRLGSQCFRRCTRNLVACVSTCLPGRSSRQLVEAARDNDDDGVTRLLLGAARADADGAVVPAGVSGSAVYGSNNGVRQQGRGLQRWIVGGGRLVPRRRQSDSGQLFSLGNCLLVVVRQRL